MCLSAQWGKAYDVSNPYEAVFPINFSNIPYVVIPIDTNTEKTPIIFGTDYYTKRGFKIAGRRVSGETNLWYRYIAIGT